MSRIRSVHPGLWTDEAFVSMSPLARVFFIGLWTEADDKGTFPWSPLKLKMRILPADNADVESLLGELVSGDAVMRYEVDGKEFGAIRNFTKFQRPKKPNDIHPCTKEACQYTGQDKKKQGVSDRDVPDQSESSSEPVPHHSGKVETDGGWRMEDGVISPKGDCASDNALKPEHIVEKWNEVAPRIARPSVRDLTPERRQLTKARIAQYSLEDFMSVFAKVESSAFLRGDLNWKGVTFDWIMKKGNFQKIIEGNYDD